MNEWALSILASPHPSVGEPGESMEPLTRDTAEMSVAVYSLTGVEPTGSAFPLFPSSMLSPHLSPVSCPAEEGGIHGERKVSAPGPTAGSTRGSPGT